MKNKAAAVQVSWMNSKYIFSHLWPGEQCWSVSKAGVTFWNDKAANKGKKKMF